MKISIRFSLASAKTEELPIRMRISYDGQRLDLRTGYVCHPDKWDAEICRVRPGTVNRYKESASTINRNLSAQESVVVEILQKYELDHKIPTPSVVKYDFNTAMGRKAINPSQDKSVTLPDLFRRYMIEHGKDAALEYGTIIGYKTVLDHVNEMPWSDKPVEEITQQDLSLFINRMWDEDIENQTVNNYVTKIKSVLYWAKKSIHVYHGTVHEEFSPKLKGLGKKDVQYLEWDEFEKILYLRLDNDNLVAIRDSFCFCCATGLRISDCSKLKWRDVILTAEIPYIQVMVKKTTKPIIIELNKYSRAIIDRQLSSHRNDLGPNDTVFPKISLSVRNRQLPVIAKMAEIKSTCRRLSFVGNKVTEKIAKKADEISTHWGRHTFIVHALHLGISPNVIMSWTGHSSYDAMKPYIAIANKTKAEKMSLFDA